MSSLPVLGDAPRQLPPMSRPSTMRREFVLNPIAALGFYTSPTDARLYLLAAEDNHLSIYDVEASRLCGDVRIFTAQSVHGIEVTASDGGTRGILAWGGYSVAVVPVQTIEHVISGRAERDPGTGVVITAKASDWIFEAAISPHRAGELALLTAHNDLIPARYDEENGRITFLGIESPSRPILYSGNLSWDEPDSILVAAGTVFGEIVIWKYATKPQDHRSRCEVLFVLSGHEGSIFGVHISPIFTLETGESLRLLASCSDDRTIRVWDITDPRDASRKAHDKYQEKILAVRETGFGGDATDNETAQGDTSVQCLAVAMGHISRIWQVEFPRQQSLTGGASSIQLWSFGEDATAQKWSLPLSNIGGMLSAGQSADSPTRFEDSLKNEAVFANHSGKNIWSHAMTFDNSGQLLVVTGASDGKISIIGNSQRGTAQKTLDHVPPAPNAEIIEQTEALENPEAITPPQKVDAEPVTSEVGSQHNPEGPVIQKSSEKPKKPKKPKVKRPARDFFNRYALLADGSLITSSKNGRFFVGNVTEDTCWKELFLPDGFSEMSSTYAVVKGSFQASSAYIGTAEGDVFTYCRTEPLKLTHLARVNSKVSDIFLLSATRLLVTVLGSETASLLDFEESTSTLQPKQIDVPVDKRFTITSAALDHNTLILGSRTGYISILEATIDGPYKSLLLVEPKTNDCVTCVTVLPSNAYEGHVDFLTTSRDGKYRIYTIKHNGKHSSVMQIHETSPPFGPIIEGAWFSHNEDGSIDLILYGFRSTRFVVWNETKQQEITTIDCGGGHRTFCYDPLPGSPERLRLVWTQASKLCFFSQTHAPHITLKSGGHGREIKAISASGNLIATAAEDTAIRIWSYAGQERSRERKLRCLAVLDSHTAGIQTLRWYKESHLFSSGGNKEFFIWRVNHLNSAYGGLAVRCEAVYPDRADDIDLRIMNFDVHCRDETSAEGLLFYISMALSNSTLLTYVYSEQAGFRLIAKGSYTGACMTQLQHIHVDDATIQTLTAATDGHITIWEVKLPKTTDVQISEHGSLAVTKLHQSTMKSLEIRTIPSTGGTSYLIVTGGDDNGLGVAHLFRDATSGAFEMRSKSIVRSAHAAAVTGIAVLNLASSQKDAIVVSCSNDQRVKRWQIGDWQSKQVRAKLLDNAYSSIADPGDLEVLEEGRRFAVGGVGMEVWDVAGDGDGISRSQVEHTG